MLIISTIFFIIFAIISLFLSSNLNISYPLLIFTGIFIIGSFIYPIVAGILQGMKKFGVLGFNSIINCTIKLVLALILVALGFKVYGAVAGFVFGVFAAFFIVFISIREITSAKKEDMKIEMFSRSSIYTIIAMLFMVSLYSLDVIFAKTFFTPEIAGKYAVISMIGKIILFVILSITTAMFPINSEKFAKGYETKHILKKVLGFSTFLCILALLFMIIFPKFIISLLFGSAYTSFSGILLYIGISFSFIALLNVLLLYIISIDKLRAIELISMALFLVLQIILFTLFHSNITQFSMAFMISSIMAFLGGLLLLNRK